MRSPLGQCVLPKDADSQTAEEGSALWSFVGGNPGKPSQPLQSLAEHGLVEEQGSPKKLLSGRGDFGWTSVSEGAPKRELSWGNFVGGRSSYKI